MGANQNTVAVLDPSLGGTALDFRKLIVDAGGFLKISGTTTGSFSATGLSQGIRTTKMTVGDVPVKLPSVPYSLRNTVSIRIGGLEPIYVGNSSVTVAGVETPAASGIFVNAGYPKYQLEEIAADIIAGAAVDIWGVCETGKTSFVWILEIG